MSTTLKPVAVHNGNPKEKLYEWYRDRCKTTLSKDCYITWQSAPCPALKWSAFFVCPFTAEIFLAEPTCTHPYPDKQPTPSDIIIWQFGKKVDAEHGAAAHAFNCLSYRDALLQTPFKEYIIYEIFPWNEEKTECLPCCSRSSLSALPPDLGVSLEALAKFDDLVRKLGSIRAPVPSTDSTTASTSKNPIMTSKGTIRGHDVDHLISSGQGASEPASNEAIRSGTADYLSPLRTKSPVDRSAAIIGTTPKPKDRQPPPSRRLNKPIECHGASFTCAGTFLPSVDQEQKSRSSDSCHISSPLTETMRYLTVTEQGKSIYQDLDLPRDDYTGPPLIARSAHDHSSSGVLLEQNDECSSSGPTVPYRLSSPVKVETVSDSDSSLN